MEPRLPPRVLGRALFWPSMATLAPQGLRVRRSAPRFEPAAGPREGRFGDGDTRLRLLGVGDSIIDGVGLASSHETMAVQAAKSLAERGAGAVSWQLQGKSGVTSEGALARLRTSGPLVFDHAIVSVGVNDVTALRRTGAWRDSTRALAAELLVRSPHAHVWFVGLPPLHGFPLLPEPIRSVLGARARAFDAVLAAWCAETPQVHHVPTRFVPEAGQFAADGYHPNAASHAVWGEQVAEAIGAA